MAIFEKRFSLACPIETVFEFLLDPQNAVEVAPPETYMRLLEAPDRLEVGSTLTFQVRAYGHDQTVEHEIIELDPPNRMVEKQIAGPAKKWWHEHRLEDLGDGNTELVDHIDFDPPGGLVGLIVNEKFIRKILVRSMDYREEVMREMLEDG